MNQEPVFHFVIWGTILWVIFMFFAEPVRETFSRYFRPNVRFVTRLHSEDAYLDIVDNTRKLIGIEVYIKGHFENTGAPLTTVKSMELQLVKRLWIFHQIIGRKTNRAVITDKTKWKIVGAQGIPIAGYTITPEVDLDATCLCGNKCPLDKLNSKYFIRVRWNVLGQAVKSENIQPDWDAFRRLVKLRLSELIPGMEGFGT